MKDKSSLRGYASLAARLKKERERGNELARKLDEVNDDEKLYELVKNNTVVKNRIIADYLARLSTINGPCLVSTGLTALTPVNKPKNLADAKRIAEKIIRY